MLLTSFQENFQIKVFLTQVTYLDKTMQFQSCLICVYCPTLLRDGREAIGIFNLFQALQFFLYKHGLTSLPLHVDQVSSQSSVPQCRSPAPCSPPTVKPLHCSNLTVFSRLLLMSSQLEISSKFGLISDRVLSLRCLSFGTVSVQYNQSAKGNAGDLQLYLNSIIWNTR